MKRAVIRIPIKILEKALALPHGCEIVHVSENALNPWEVKLHITFDLLPECKEGEESPEVRLEIGPTGSRFSL